MTKCPVCNEETDQWSLHWKQMHQKDYGYGVSVARVVWRVYDKEATNKSKEMNK